MRYMNVKLDDRAFSNLVKMAKRYHGGNLTQQQLEQTAAQALEVLLRNFTDVSDHVTHSQTTRPKTSTIRTTTTTTTPKLDTLRRLRNQGKTYQEIADVTGNKISRWTVSNWLRNA